MVIDKRRLKKTEMPSYNSKHIPKETYAAMEASRNWSLIYKLLEKHVDRVELTSKYGRYGYRGVTALLRNEGWIVNRKRGERI